MTRIAKAHVIALGLSVFVAACATPQTALQMEKASGGEVVTVNPDFKLDHELGEAGRVLWVNKGCAGCHTVGLGRASGPDLFGVTERRPVDWLTSFLKNTPEMLDTDPLAQALLKQYNNQRMPDMRLTNQEIEALIHYLQLRTGERRAGE